MAPEAIRGDISAKMDVWAYGVVSFKDLDSNIPPPKKFNLEMLF